MTGPVLKLPGIHQGYLLCTKGALASPYYPGLPKGLRSSLQNPETKTQHLSVSRSESQPGAQVEGPRSFPTHSEGVPASTASQACGLARAQCLAWKLRPLLAGSWLRGVRWGCHPCHRRCRVQTPSRPTGPTSGTQPTADGPAVWLLDCPMYQVGPRGCVCREHAWDPFPAVVPHTVEVTCRSCAIL